MKSEGGRQLSVLNSEKCLDIDQWRRGKTSLLSTERGLSLSANLNPPFVVFFLLSNSNFYIHLTNYVDELD